MCIFIHKIYEDNSGGCKKSFSWVGQKVKKKSPCMAAMMPTTPALMVSMDTG